MTSEQHQWEAGRVLGSQRQQELGAVASAAHPGQDSAGKAVLRAKYHRQ